MSVSKVRVEIESVACFLAITDEASETARPAFWSSPLEQRRPRLKAAKELLETFEWNPLMDGTFSIDLEAEVQRDESTWPKMLGRPRPFSLRLATGHLVIVSGSQAQLSLVLDAGLYDGMLLWDDNREIDHWHGAPPGGDAPVGVIKLWKAT